LDVKSTTKLDDYMELLAEISNKTFGFKPAKNVHYTIRKAARAIVINKNNEIALMHAKKYNYYKIPGGGIEVNESIKQALKREVLEEAGCKVKINGPVGTIIEYRDKIKVIQISYCFVTHVIGNPKKSNLTKAEKEEEFEVKWITGLEKAIRLIQDSSKVERYLAKFMVKRDTIFLKAAEDILSYKK
jgi:8-oxo-dGTP diphosphatase